MRFATLAVALLAACSNTPRPSSHEPVERLQAAEEVATWAMDAERAPEKAMAVMDAEPDRFTMIEVGAAVRHGSPFWRVSPNSLIAGGWDVEIDPRTSQIASARQ